MISLKKNRVIVLTTLVAAGLMLTGQILFAQPGQGRGQGRGMGRGMGQGAGGGCMAAFELDLTDSQIEKLAQLRSDLFKEELPLLRQRWEKMEAMQELMESESQDRTKIENLHVEIVELNAKLERTRADASEKALKVLTEDQRRELGNRPIPIFDQPGLGGGPGNGGPGFGSGRGQGQRWNDSPPCMDSDGSLPDDRPRYWRRNNR